MSGAAEQTSASLSIMTPLGPDVLQPIGLEAEEAISAPFAFTVRRASERQGIEHTPNAHTLLVTDCNQAFAPLDQPVHRVVHAGRNAEVLSGWHKLNTTAHGSITLLDYDPEKPSTHPRGQDSTALKTSGASLRDVFIWPTHFHRVRGRPARGADGRHDRAGLGGRFGLSDCSDRLTGCR